MLPLEHPDRIQVSFDDQVVSRQQVYKRVILVDVDQAAASSILGSGSASLPTAFGMVR